MNYKMKNILTIVVLLFVTPFIFGQKTLFNDLKVDKTTKIVGRIPHYDKSKMYEKYNFIIEDSTEIANFIKDLHVDSEVPNALENPNFKLTIVKNNREMGSWTINPTQKSAMTHDGKTYKFDLNQIINLYKRFPLRYYHEIKVFKSRELYDDYLVEQQKNPNFLFDYAPQFKYECSFEIEFKKSSKFSSPKAISDYLIPLIEKIVKKDEYSLSYTLDEKNLNDMNQYTMTIRGSKKLFQKLEVKKLVKENFETIVEDGYFFYKE